MRINLAVIPTDGANYIWTNKTRELNQDLEDLIGSLPYQAEFFIKPMTTKDYEISGSIKTEVPEICSRCGEDFNLSVNEKFRGILIPRSEDDRTGKYAKVNHVSELDGGPEVFEYDAHSNQYEMGEHIHEVVALAVPFKAICDTHQQGNCTVCKRAMKDCECLFKYDEVMPEEKPESPFRALKNIKLN